MSEKLKQVGWDLYFLANRWKRESMLDIDFRQEARELVDTYATNKAVNAFFMGIMVGSSLTTLIVLILIS
jgi:hypothetical protein